MAEDLRMALQELLRKAELDQDVDSRREGVRVMAQQLMEIEVALHVGAEKYERVADRSGERNGYRDRTWDARVGSVELWVPRVRDGGYYPALLEPRLLGERALVAVVQEAYVQGVSTRRVDDLVKAPGMNGISKSQVSRLCRALDTEVERFRTRMLDGAYPFCWLAATFLKVRHDHRVVSMAVVLPWASTAMVNAKCSGWTSGRVKTEHSGWRFCAVWSHVVGVESSWSPATATRV